MSREVGLLIVLAVAGIALLLMLWGWRRRTRRDAELVAPAAALTGETVLDADGFYVATTAHDDALNRLAIRGLAFRSRVHITVLRDGLRLGLQGGAPVSIAAADIVAVDRATVAIDRVVERGGMVRVVWHVTPTRVADLYLRLQQTSHSELLAAIDSIIPAPASTGADA